MIDYEKMIEEELALFNTLRDQFMQMDARHRDYDQWKFLLELSLKRLVWINERNKK
jgi:hypothetical protein